MQSWQIRSTIAGPTFNGKIALFTGLLFLFSIGTAFRKREKKIQKKSDQKERWEECVYQKRACKVG